MGDATDGDRRLMYDTHVHDPTSALANTRALLGRAVNILTFRTEHPIKRRLGQCYVEAIGSIPATHRLEKLPPDLAFEVRNLRDRFTEDGALVATLNAMTDEDVWRLVADVYRVHHLASKKARRAS
jgi:hypothetical protein